MCWFDWNMQWYGVRWPGAGLWDGLVSSEIFVQCVLCFWFVDFGACMVSGMWC